MEECGNLTLLRRTNSPILHRDIHRGGGEGEAQARQEDGQPGRRQADGGDHHKEAQDARSDAEDGGEERAAVSFLRISE